ncbi:MAG: Mur ligase family protein [Chlamydiales bacterium]
MSKLHPHLEESLEVKSMKMDLDRMHLFDAALGFPSKAFLCVHIAGTNGKGSVAAKVASACHVSGKKVGLYTSPHLFSYCERVQINQNPISEEKADALLKTIVRALPFKATYFELMTLLAFYYFAEQKIDLAVLEVGMGGRLDATNIATPLVSVITSIDRDHTQYLGSTLEAIAFEKGGIIKPEVPVVLGPQAKPFPLFKKIAAEKNSPLFQVKGFFAHYEEENRAISHQAISLLPYPFESKSIQQGLKSVPPCRFEYIDHDGLPLILDVGHNPAALESTFRRISLLFKEKLISVLAAFSEGKEVDEMIRILLEKADFVALTQPNHPRACTIERLDAPFCHKDRCFSRAFEVVYQRAAQKGQLMLICGTFFMMEEVRLCIRNKLGKRERFSH